ncbi:MAG TPA: nucleotidyltransferase domain-containing protein [Leptospiraceae bacterium]|nr:nucleotidyltransferase domain-containing protein [Leptospiraceae bacterium]HMX33951.1 nucleotidyltransferase domain-containing protein [Leptospiraceae bacterium]HMY34226.1 nucleotidyltransferase domain-containing protein [Leptospiraceae bacterium]HMZ66751.1 nucleotidyltransferase domain-containing protein [Leptospiraceae bacterium]HNA09913.1 nucleotidyltransferase domain-containing protein [Leptospiraceae bacterium]
MNSLNFLDSKETEALRKFKDTLIGVYSNEIAGFYLFGSKARGDFNKKSDIDILITIKTDDWKLRDKIRRLGYEFDEEIEYRFSILVLPESKFHYLKENKFQFALNILRDGVQI